MTAKGVEVVAWGPVGRVLMGEVTEERLGGLIVVKVTSCESKWDVKRIGESVIVSRKKLHTIRQVD